MLRIILIFLCVTIHKSAGARRPHIIFILADDLGWNDVGFHGTRDIRTPNIDLLAYTGVILNRYYVNPLCTPSRSALMTGKYPIHTGLQHGVIHGSTPYGLSLGEKILPQYLKELGYTTRAVGKWHLGHHKMQYTPEQRGFDSHYGYWLGAKDYFDHGAIDTISPFPYYWGYDLKRGLNSSLDDYGIYTTDLFTDEAVRIINQHDVSNSLFLYIAHQAVHSGSPFDPLQVPSEATKKFNYIQDENRKSFAGMLAKLDDSVGEVISALARKKMLNSSIIVFSTDNGGPAAGFNNNAASNWPLRGVKSTLWEGGVRGVGLIWTPFQPDTKVFNGLMHVTDWLPTLLQGIQSNVSLQENIDGMNLWDALFKAARPPRKNILLNIDPVLNVSALILGKYKFIKGYSGEGVWDGWFGPSGRLENYDWEGLWQSKAAKHLQTIRPLPSQADIENIIYKTSVSCKVWKRPSRSPLQCKNEIFYFNLEKDPCELHNLAPKKPIQIERAMRHLAHYMKSMRAPRNKPINPLSNPKYWSYQWVNWMDYI